MKILSEKIMSTEQVESETDYVVCKVDKYGNKRYYNAEGKLHREDGPAREWVNGYKSWYINGRLHREDGPAIEYANGHKEWHLNGKYHRENGPAVEWADGDKSWHINGKCHREDGPAVEYANGNKYWYLNDKIVPKEIVSKLGKMKDEYKGLRKLSQLTEEFDGYKTELKKTSFHKFSDIKNNMSPDRLNKLNANIRDELIAISSNKGSDEK